MLLIMMRIIIIYNKDDSNNTTTNNDNNSNSNDNSNYNNATCLNFFSDDHRVSNLKEGTIIRGQLPLPNTTPSLSAAYKTSVINR